MTGLTMREFSWAGYRNLIQTFVDQGYTIQPIAAFDPGEAHLLLRHDIDFSMEAAVDIARVEADSGWRAHYYVLLQTEFYNLCGPEDWNRLRALRDLGHDVGLHFDASRYPQDVEALEEAVALECGILERMLDREVTNISFHRPAPSLLGLDRKLAGRDHLYRPRYFSDIAYVADSRGLFRYGHPFDHDAFAEKRAMQLLTHPIWWQEDEAADKMSILDAFLSDRAAILRAETIANCLPYAEHCEPGRRK